MYSVHGVKPQFSHTKAMMNTIQGNEFVKNLRVDRLGGVLGIKMSGEECMRGKNHLKKP